MNCMECPRCSSHKVAYYEKESITENYLFMSRLNSRVLMLLYCLFKKANKDSYGDECLCQDCGYRWYTKTAEQQKKILACVNRLINNYPAIQTPAADGGYLILDQDGIVIYHPRKRFSAIPYEQLAKIEINNTEEEKIISFRHVGNAKKTLPRNIKEARKDKLTLVCLEEYIEIYNQIAQLLLEIVKVNLSANE